LKLAKERGRGKKKDKMAAHLSILARSGKRKEEKEKW